MVDHSKNGLKNASNFVESMAPCPLGEMVDAADLKSANSNVMPVRVWQRALFSFIIDDVMPINHVYDPWMMYRLFYRVFKRA
jgi:hypothetical protein